MTILDQLHQDHVNYSKLLDLLDEEIRLMETPDGNPDLYKMYMIMKYMHHYPDIYHHPHEEIIFNHLAGVDFPEKEIINEIAKEHDHLTRLGGQLEDILRNIINCNIYPKDKIIEPARKYITSLKQHMDIEEGKIFPVIKQLMKKDDWEAVQNQVEHIHDPLFGEVISDEYSSIYESISKN